ncbi:MAG TPA: DUF6768 family protein [Opitutaceae bacterium]|nr:DUF6768 family protein [Opitutaceae bacterium]
MNNIDQKIQAALRREGAGENIIKEPNLAEEVITAFRGRNRFTNMMALFWSIVSLALFVWSAWRFYVAEVVREQMLWGGLCLYFLIFIAFMKVWFWLEMHSNRVLRELKRIELLLVTRRSE